MIIYFALALVGFLFLGLTFLIGELDDLFNFDFGDDTDGVHPLNAKTLAAALTAFGATGMLATYYGAGPLGTALLSGAVALGVGAVGWWLLGLIYNQQASSELLLSSIQGALAEVTTAIPAGGIGNILYVGSGSSKQLLARTEDGGEIPAGKTVRIITTRGNTAVVELFER